MASTTQRGGANIVWAISPVDFDSTTAKSTNDKTISVTGAQLGDPVILGGSALPPANTNMKAFVSNTDEVTVRFCNFSGGTVDPDSFVATVGVVKLNQE